MLRRVLVAAALAVSATATAVLPAAPAQARACTINHYCYTTWYSNAAHTTVVGGKYEDCDGDITQWGVRSAYITWSEHNC
jgi:hypothetical protein